MAGEMTREDIESGGEWYEAAEDLYAASVYAGLNGEVHPFDQYQGPYCNLMKEGLVVGELWLAESGFLVKVIDGRKSESKVCYEGSEIYNFVLSTWQKWNDGFNPEKPKETWIISGSKEDDFLKIEENGKSKIYKKSQIGDELFVICKYPKAKIIEYDFRFWVESETE